MSIIIFILVLVALIVVHELGHFVVAKLSGMRVDEFGLGYPPRALTIATKGETAYTLNWLPFGGFVRIFGEDATGEEAQKDPRAFSSRPRILQALVLVAGIAMNLLFAWVLISATLYTGTVRELTPEEAVHAPDAALVVASVLPGSPAAQAGLAAGDTIVDAQVGSERFSGASALGFTDFIASVPLGTPLTLGLMRAGQPLSVTATPRAGIISATPSRPALGVGISAIGTISVPLWKAPLEGAKLTWEATKETAIGLVHFFAGVFTFTADLSQVAGPIGIAGAVGAASSHGLAALLTITAIISINLALINVLPIPALDGGRLLFVIIEAITRKPIRPSFANAVNTVGFGFLILLMVVVSAHDIFKIFS